MNLDPTRRSVLLLLGCLTVSLVFPRACSETRLGAGALLPATAPLTADVQRDERADIAEAWLQRTQELVRLRELTDARPTVLPSALGGTVIEEPGPETAYRAVPARLVHRGVSRTRRSFVIDSGRDRGLSHGLAVAHGNSLVGVIAVASDGAARVVRIDDDARDNVFPAVVRPRDLLRRDDTAPVGDLAAREDAPATGDHIRRSGVARGAGDGTVIVSYLGEGAARVGDLVATDAGRYGVPEGLLIGEVVAFDDDDRDGIWEARVQPLRDLDTIASVLVYVPPRLDEAVRPRESRR